MQNENQTPISQQRSTAKLVSPIEIDAALLHLVSGGAPKAGWAEPQALSVANSDQAPKAGW